jgi:hypothetical protein
VQEYYTPFLPFYSCYFSLLTTSLTHARRFPADIARDYRLGPKLVSDLEAQSRPVRLFRGTATPKPSAAPGTAQPRGEVVTVDRVERSGQAATTSTLLYLDRAARAYEGGGCSGTQSSRHLDLQTVEILRQCVGGDSERIVRRLDPSGQQLVVEITTRHSGRRSEQRLVLEKQ